MRSIAEPRRDCTSDELAGAISEYIELFDRLVKGYITGRFTAGDIDGIYRQFAENSLILI